MSCLLNEAALRSFCIEALVRSGMASEDACTMSSILVQTEMWGIHTHGVKNLFGYIEKAEAGGVSFTARPEIVKKAGSVIVIDGHNTMGYISSSLAMREACALAAKNGIAMALVKNSCHFGAAGAYANMAAMEGMVGIACSNVDKKMSIPGARGMIMGHNPFAFAAPTTGFPSVILDISSSNVASLRVLKAKHSGELIPETWISDADGNPTTDPSKYPDEGALLPMGGHKGYGIAMFVEILTSVLLDCPTSTEGEVTSWCFDPDKPNNVSHSFIVIDPDKMGQGFAERVGRFVRELQSAPKAKGCSRITVPGERMWERYVQAMQAGVELPDDVVDELQKIEAKLGISWKDY